MEAKKTSFFAHSHIERATKLFISLFLLIILMSFSSVYAITEEEVRYAYDFIGATFSESEFQTAYNQIKAYENTYGNLVVYCRKNQMVCFGFTEETPEATNSAEYPHASGRYSTVFYTDSIRQQWGSWNFLIDPTRTDTCWYFPNGIKNYGGNGYMYEPGTVLGDWEIDKAAYKVPYFEFSANKVGTATFENEDGNINTYYKNSFPIWTNSYGTFREIGNLYIDSKYIWDDIFFPELYITKKNFSQTNQWEYVEYDFFKHEEENQYVRYSINVRNDLITAPYLYEIEILTINSALSDDVNIKFVVINQNDSSGGIIIENNSGDRISGDEIKDTTSLGDINNTIGEIQDSINEPYNPNESTLNNLNSGDILNSMGYEVNEDPNKDLWDVLIKGLEETLTGDGEVVFEFNLRQTKHRISSENIYMPPNILKTFIGMFINFILLMQMYTFIKRTIDQINEGNINVIENVSADTYFF